MGPQGQTVEGIKPGAYDLNILLMLQGAIFTYICTSARFGFSKITPWKMEVALDCYEIPKF